MSQRILLVLVLVALAACGGGASDQTTAATSPTTLSGDGGSGENGSGDGGSSGDGIPPAQCIAVATALSQAATMGMAAGQGTDLDSSADALAGMATAAPAEVADDFEVLANAYREFGQALADADIDLADPASYSTPEGQAAFLAATEAFNNADVEAAADSIDDYMSEICG